jgi:hypothetical protein
MDGSAPAGRWRVVRPDRASVMEWFQVDCGIQIAQATGHRYRSGRTVEMVDSSLWWEMK